MPCHARRNLTIPDADIDPEVAAWYGPRLNLVVVELMVAEHKRAHCSEAMADRAEQWAAGVVARRRQAMELAEIATI